jgi:hypothetical protein
MASVAMFLFLTLPRVQLGPVIGTGQDEWYNMIRALRMLYERLNPSYFVHPALYYEILALIYGMERLIVGIGGRLGPGVDFLDYFLVHEWHFLDLARYASVGCGALAVLAAVWLGTVLSGAGGGLLAGALVASLPLLQVLATTIRVDALALAALIAATALAVRWYQYLNRRSLVLASAGIGVAAAANYPGALLLFLLAWFGWRRPGDPLAGEPGSPNPSSREPTASSAALRPTGRRYHRPAGLPRISHQPPAASADRAASQGRAPSGLLDILLSMPASTSVRAALIYGPLRALATESGEKCGLPARRLTELAQACALALAVFIVLNPYVVIDLRLFLRWFRFLAEVPLLTHPHAPEPSVWRYIEVLRDQGPPAVLACAAAAAALVTRRQPSAALAAFGLAQLAAFSLMRSQYDRFVLPAIALLAIAGASWLHAQFAQRIGPKTAAAFAIVVAALTLWSAVERFRLEAPETANPGADYRAEMFAWIAENVPPSATLVLESDTLPLLQTVCDPGDRGGRFRASLRRAFEKRHPNLVRTIIKVQLIAAVYNYDPKLLQADDVFFLASSQNRELIAANRALLPEPAAFYDALDTRATVIHETGGFHERLLLYATRAAER